MTTSDTRSDHDCEWVLRFLSERGLEAQAIRPNPSHKTPDIVVAIGEHRVLLEVERKADDQQLRNLLSGEPGASIAYSADRTEDRIKVAWRQVRDFPDRHSCDHTLIWLIADSGAAALLAGKAARARLYGLEQLEGYTTADKFYSKTCYFFYESIFFRWKELDGVVIHRAQSLELCLNPLSPRFERFCIGPFVEALRSSMEVVDPVQEAADGRAFIADCDSDRRDSNAVVQFVRDKYALRKPTIRRFIMVNNPL